MASFQQQSNTEGHIPSEIFLAEILQIHAIISKLESLKPCKQVNSLFTKLVNLCILPSSIDVDTLPEDIKLIRYSVMNLSGKAECLLELEFATFLNQTPRPLNNLNLFPYYGNYLKLAKLEYDILKENGISQPKKVAFLGSGPMPLTSYILAMQHMTSTHFVNYDIDESANKVAGQIVATDGEFAKRMEFKTRDVMEVKEELEEYDCLFLAGLVGMSVEDKIKIIQHVRKYMKEGGFLVVRSAKGARAFLYPVVEEEYLLGLEVLSVFHPTDDVINTVILTRKPIHS